MDPAKPAKKKMSRAAKIIIAMGIVSTLSTLALAMATLVPTNVKRLSAAHPPIEDRSARKPGGAGCALSEVGVAGACKKAVITSVRDEEITFASSIPEKGLATLRGTLSIPVGVEGRRGAVILLHGSGPNDRHEKVSGDLVSKVDPPLEVFTALADLLAREGLVVLRYDKRACLRCYPDFDRKKLRDFRWGDYEIDARDALAFLATRPEVDPDALVVAGHSEGGQIAPYVARDNPHVAAVIMLAGPIDDFEVGLLGQIDRLADERWAQFDPLGAWATRRAKMQYASCFNKLRTDYDPNEMCLGGGVTQAALKDFLEYEAEMPRVLADGKCPVMAIQGSVDRNIDPLAIPAIGKALGARDHELHYVPGVNHDLVDVVTPTKPPTLSADLNRRIVAFVASVRPR
jgi:alpha-beta hydrolase superfamily lysophospholipase